MDINVMSSSASDYERSTGAEDLQTFYDSSIPKIRHPEVQWWARGLLAERASARLGRAFELDGCLRDEFPSATGTNE